MKRDKTGIWRGALLLAVVSLTLAISSCTKEPTGLSMPGGDGMEVRVTFPQSEVTRATTGVTEPGTTDENRLDRVTILVFSGDGTKLETVFSEDVTSANTSLPVTQPKWASEQTLIVSPVIAPSSPKKIYAIANWSRVDFNKATYTETMLKDEITSISAVAEINGTAAYPMLMSGSKEVANLTSLFYNVTVDVARQSSKISTLLTIPKDVQNYMPQIEWQTDLMTITVANVPNKSYVVGRSSSPAGTALLNSTVIAVDDTKPAVGDQTVPATKDLKWSERVYITENPVKGTTQAAKDASTYIIVQLPYKNRITGSVDYDNYYKLIVNDTRDATSPHKVLRNTIYNFNIRILGMGLPINNLVPDVNVDDQLTVNSWEKGEIGDVEAPLNYFNVNRSYFGFQSFETSLQTTIATDVADWKLVKADGTTLFSFAEGKTAAITTDGITYALGGNASAATITVSRPTALIDFPTNKMMFIAKNLKVPFTVAYDNGFIPNSELIKGFTIEGETYQGWPADKLPKTGLQLARRGNVLPSGTSKAYESSISWSIIYSDTGIKNKTLGAGKDNYRMLNALDATIYSIGQACKDLGPEWYVPSGGELALIFNNLSTFGTSYSLDPTNFYWSATESSMGYSLVVMYGGWNNGNKQANFRVRCVREI